MLVHRVMQLRPHQARRDHPCGHHRPAWLLPRIAGVGMGWPEHGQGEGHPLHWWCWCLAWCSSGPTRREGITPRGHRRPAWLLPRIAGMAPGMA
jgi:hypothetical protein